MIWAIPCGREPLEMRLDGTPTEIGAETMRGREGDGGLRRRDLVHRQRGDADIDT